MKKQDSQAIATLRYTCGYKCPHCGGNHIVRYGHTISNGVQIYRCKECRKYYVATTGSILSRTHKDRNIWMKYIIA